MTAHVMWAGARVNALGRRIVPEGKKPAKVARAQDRQRRLAAELRANLSKRKAQARARAAGSKRADEGGRGRG